MNLQEAHSSEENEGASFARLAPKKRRLSFARKIALFSIYSINKANARIEVLLKSAAQINN